MCLAKPSPTVDSVLSTSPLLVYRSPNSVRLNLEVTKLSEVIRLGA